MTERGFSNEELERQLQEEEMGLEQHQSVPEETPTSGASIETQNDQLEKDINPESGKAEVNQKLVEQNIAAIGGKEALEKVWNNMDVQKKETILKKVDEYSSDRQLAISGQKAAVSLLNPVENWNDTSGQIFNILRVPTTLMMTLMGPIIATGSGISETIDRVRASININREKRKLHKLEQKYQ